jgi:putative ABC transport system substrate-binding protein
MRRRDFIASLGGAAAWPLAARAQQPAMPVIGFLGSGSAASGSSFASSFRQGLKKTGYVEGENVDIEYRWADGQYDRLPGLAADLVRRQVAVIAAAGGGSGLAAKAATTTIPIVATMAGDPVKEGLVASINRPGGNVTGINLLLNALEAKKLGLIREMKPTATRIAALLNPANPSYDMQSHDLQDAARSVDQQLSILRASSEAEIDVAFTTAVQMQAGALLVGADAFFVLQRNRLVALAARHAIPAIFHLREFAVAGGLMSYGTDVPDSYRLLGLYAGRILKGEKPTDLPVQNPTKFELVINLKTAKVLGLTVPDRLLALADEVIE